VLARVRSNNVGSAVFIVIEVIIVFRYAAAQWTQRPIPSNQAKH
jgi:hypothetical protein